MAIFEYLGAHQVIAAVLTLGAAGAFGLMAATALTPRRWRFLTGVAAALLAWLSIEIALSNP